MRKFIMAGVPAAGLLLLSVLFFARDDSREPAAAEPTPAAAPVGAPNLTLRSGETLAIAAGALPAARPVILDLQLGEPSADDAPLDGRVLAEGRAPLEITGAIRGGDRHIARVEIPAGWLSTGRYIIEVRTTERTHLPLRRYALEVR